MSLIHAILIQVIVGLVDIPAWAFQSCPYDGPVTVTTYLHNDSLAALCSGNLPIASQQSVIVIVTDESVDDENLPCYPEDATVHVAEFGYAAILVISPDMDGSTIAKEIAEFYWENTGVLPFFLQNDLEYAVNNTEVQITRTTEYLSEWKAMSAIITIIAAVFVCMKAYVAYKVFRYNRAEGKAFRVGDVVLLMELISVPFALVWLIDWRQVLHIWNEKVEQLYIFHCFVPAISTNLIVLMQVKVCKDGDIISSIAGSAMYTLSVVSGILLTFFVFGNMADNLGSTSTIAGIADDLYPYLTALMILIFSGFFLYTRYRIVQQLRLAGRSQMVTADRLSRFMYYSVFVMLSCILLEILSEICDEEELFPKVGCDGLFYGPLFIAYALQGLLHCMALDTRPRDQAGSSAGTISIGKSNH